MSEGSIAKEAGEGVAALFRDKMGLSAALKASMLATGFAGIVAEYTMATIASYLLGGAVIQYVLVITVMLFAMSVGSKIAGRVTGALMEKLIWIEVALSVLCGSAGVLSYGSSWFTGWFVLVIYAVAIAIGILVGMEIPLVARVNAEYESEETNVASIMNADYIGSLVGGFFFAFVALPRLGMTWTPVACGTVNLIVAGLLLAQTGFFRRRHMQMGFCGAVAALFFCAAAGPAAISWGEQAGYKDQIIYSERSKYQRLVLTQWQGYHTLYLNKNIQFSTYDEERYHEPLVHPALELASEGTSGSLSVLMLGAGDGMAAREALKHKAAVESIDLVDLDPAVTALAQKHPALKKANKGSLESKKVRVHHADAREWLEKSRRVYDVIIMDLPDPNSVDLARLYTAGFYKLVAKHLSRGGVMVTQATSPYFSPGAHYSILKTVRSLPSLSAAHYHAHVPSMGEWGWVIAQKKGARNASALSSEKMVSEENIEERLARLRFGEYERRFLTENTMQAMLAWSPRQKEHYDQANVNRTSSLSLYYAYRGDPRWSLY